MSFVADGRRKVLSLLRRLAPRIGLRDSDVLLASFPKSGNTWLRFIWANIVSLREFGGEVVDFDALNRRFGSDYDAHEYGSLDFQCLPRLVKTHRRYSGRAFGGNRCVHLLRHPGDVMVSYHRYLSSRESGGEVSASLTEFIKDRTHGVRAWCRHVESWAGEADAVVRYGSLHDDAVRLTSGLLEELGIAAIGRSTVRAAVERSSFDRLRGLEEERGRPRAGEFEPGHRFMRKGRVGEWREALEPEAKDYLWRTLSGHGLDDLFTSADGGGE